MVGFAEGRAAAVEVGGIPVLVEMVELRSLHCRESEIPRPPDLNRSPDLHFWESELGEETLGEMGRGGEEAPRTASAASAEERQSRSTRGLG